MKYLFLIFLLTNAFSAHAWDKKITCDGDLLVVDSQPYRNTSGIQGQMVFRGSLAQWMVNNRFIAPSQLNNKGELILPVDTGEYGKLTLCALDVQSKLSYQLYPGKPQLIITNGYGCGVGKQLLSYNFSSCNFQ